MIPCPPTNPRISWLLTYKSYHWVCDWHSGARLGLLPVCSGHLDAAQRLLLRLALSLRCQVGERMIIMDEDPEQHQSQDNLRFPSCFYSSRRNVASPFADRALSVPPSTYTSGWFTFNIYIRFREIDLSMLPCVSHYKSPTILFAFFTHPLEAMSEEAEGTIIWYR